MKVVILGGGFCGTTVANQLDKHEECESVLIDNTKYFEYTPGLPRLLTSKSDLRDIMVPYSSFLENTRVFVDRVTRVTPKKVTTKKGRSLRFDYLVIALGTEYPICLQNKENVFTSTTALKLAKTREHLHKAEKILVIGGGVIGTEVAAELSTQTPKKQITLVHSHDRLLERTPRLASIFAENFLARHNVTLHFNEKIIKHENDTFFSNRDQRIHADIGIWCAGFAFTPSYMKGFPNECFTPRGALRVNQHLQLKGMSNIFVGGDITSIREEKTGAHAEIHGNTISQNILRKENNETLVSYKSYTLPLVISLGRKNGIITLPPFAFPGVIPALSKWLIERVSLGIW